MLAEGIFDILNVHLNNVLGLNDTASIYGTALNKAYATAQRLCRIKIGLPYATTVCLLDQDMKLSKRVMETMRSKEVLNYINSSGKDFGEENIKPILIGRYKPKEV